MLGDMADGTDKLIENLQLGNVFLNIGNQTDMVICLDIKHRKSQYLYYINEFSSCFTSKRIFLTVNG